MMAPSSSCRCCSWSCPVRISEAVVVDEHDVRARRKLVEPGFEIGGRLVEVGPCQLQRAQVEA
jgi:hypothetical protein